jgi:hypothetical protein
MINRYIVSSSECRYGTRHALDYYTDNSGHNNHNTITKVPFCNNSDWSYRNGATTARITYNI